MVVHLRGGPSGRGRGRGLYSSCGVDGMKMGIYTTKVKAGDSKVYNLGKDEHMPTHDHPRGGSCPGCIVINAWTEWVSEEATCIE